jgi:demethylmenaquinone methyltransferase/2-methoxy-6-polyprenyl-1,4-benzoquinol methylase
MSLFHEETGSKGRYVQGLFSSIAGSYDFADTLLSFNRDRYWRRFTALRTGLKPRGKALDVATGTGKLALELAQEAGGVGDVVGVDFCDEMLSRAQDKLAKTKHRNITLALASAGALPFPDNTFDCVTIGFGLRNVADIEQTLREMTRVVKVGARVVCLEFSQPENHVFRVIYRPYLFHVLPFLGGLISGDRVAYSYLPRSIARFSRPHEVRQVMEEVGLRDVEIYFLTMGVVAVCVGIKG